MNDEDLKSCPFCGGEVKAQKSEFFDVALLFFTCSECGAKVSFDDPTCNVGAEYGDYSPTINAWNQRAERTCKLEDDDSEPASLVCSSCHSTCAITWVTGEWNYCPNCGAKVVSE